MEILRDFLETSTIHGLAYISNVPSKPGKALWLTIVTAGFCTAGYLINSSYEEWESTPVATSISTHPIATLPLPIITICPPEHANTVLNVDLVRAGNISLTKADRQALINVSRQLFIHKPSQNFVDVAQRLTNKEAIPQLKAETRSYPSSYENTDRGSNQGFEIWSTELAGNYSTPGFGSTRNCSKNDPNIHFTLYIPQTVVMRKENLVNESFEVEIVALNCDEFEVEYREGDKYIFHGTSGEFKFWSDAEDHCNEQNGHLVSIHTNYDFKMFDYYQQRAKNTKRVWLGGTDERVESIWEWSDGTPWANKSVARCNEVPDIQEHGVKSCTNWASKHPGGGEDKNCLIVDKSGNWMSEYCEGNWKKLPYWCHITPVRMEGTKKLSWKLTEITFSKIELWLTKKTGGEETCKSSSKMPGFSLTWSTKVNGRSNASMGKVFTVPGILKSDKLYYIAKKEEYMFSFLNHNLMDTILACRNFNMTTPEIWEVVQTHKRELVEGKIIGCRLGLVKSEDFLKLIANLKNKIPKNLAKVTYTETPDDYALAFEVFSYLLFCQREQIEMAAFYKNLFHTANPRTILQATVNNIQIGVEEADTMVALHQMFTIMAKKMELKLPHILQGFLDSKMLEDVDPKKDIFFNRNVNDNSEQPELPYQGKYFWAK